MALKDDPIVIRLASARNGPAWAKRLVGGVPWSALSKAQKAAARASGVVSPLPLVVVPTTPRLVGGNPTRQKRVRSQPGNAADRETVTRSEPLGCISSFAGIKTWVIDPRDPATFPLLCRSASGYNSYQFSKLALRYTPTCGAESAGALVVSFSTDSTDCPPTGKLALYQSGTKHILPVSKGALITLPVPRDTKALRDSSSEDGKLVDAGKIYLACDNVEGTCGQLFIEYSLVLKERQFNNPDTQEVVSGIHTSGPRYTIAKLDGADMSIRFVAAGKWMVAIKGNKHDIPKVHGCRGRVASATESGLTVGMVTIEAEEPDGELRLKFSSDTDTDMIYYVSRM